MSPVLEPGLCAWANLGTSALSSDRTSVLTSVVVPARISGHLTIAMSLQGCGCDFCTPMA